MVQTTNSCRSYTVDPLWCRDKSGSRINWAKRRTKNRIKARVLDELGSTLQYLHFIRIHGNCIEAQKQISIHMRRQWTVIGCFRTMVYGCEAWTIDRHFWYHKVLVVVMRFIHQEWTKLLMKYVFLFLIISACNLYVILLNSEHDYGSHDDVQRMLLGRRSRWMTRWQMEYRQTEWMLAQWSWLIMTGTDYNG